MSKSSVNKEMLNDYLSDFECVKSKEILKLFKEDDFNQGKTKFKSFMKSVIGMPMSGKHCLEYWTSRGWSDKISEEKRVKIKNLSSPMKLSFWVDKGFSEDEAKNKIKSFRKTNIEYWLRKGFDEDEAKSKLKEFQKEASSKINRSKVLYPNQISYWVDKGFSEDEAKNKISQRQTTFSKEICIEKYGVDKGLKVWEDRQEKWLKSFKKAKDNKVWSNVSNIIECYKNRHGKDWLNKCIESHNYTHKFKEVLYKIDGFSDVKSFIGFYLDNIEFETFGKSAYPFLKSKIVQEFFNLDFYQLREIFFNHIGIIPSKYGNMRYFNSHICRSNGEYEIAKYLKENGIDYIYEKRYDNLSYISDFYLIKHDLYLEYTGMSFKTKHKEKYIVKEQKCIEFGYNTLFCNDVDKIINYIDEIERKN